MNDNQQIAMLMQWINYTLRIKESFYYLISDLKTNASTNIN